MHISPPTYALGAALGVGAGSSAIMAATNQRTAQQTREAANVFGLPLAGLAMATGIVGQANVETQAYRLKDANALVKWASGEAKLTGLTKSGQLFLGGLGLAVGVGIADLAASQVLKIDDKSFVGNG